MKIDLQILADTIAKETIKNLNNLKNRYWYLPRPIIAGIYNAGYKAGSSDTGKVYEDIIEECVLDADDIMRINTVNEIMNLELLLHD